MKTISGKVASTKQLPLSKAARVLSNFVAAGTGASTDVSAYLSRAVVSFNELVQFHKELKVKKHKTEKRSAESDQKHPKEIRNDEDSVNHGKNRGDSEVGKKRKTEKSKNHEEKEREGAVVEDGNRKKRKNRENGGEIPDLSELNSPKKKKKRRKTENGQ